MEAKSKKRTILFIGIMLTSGWIGAGINVLLQQKQGVESLGSLLWILTPLMMVIIFRTIDHEWKVSGIFPHFKGNACSYMLAILFYPILTALSVGLGILFGQAETGSFSWNVFLPIMFGSISVNVFKNISEEIAWRGYLTQKLISLKLKDWQVYLITGLVWNLWHGAYYLIFLPDEYFARTSRSMLLIWGCVLLIAWSVLFGEIYRHTQSIWPCVLLHAFEDGVPTVLTMTGGFVVFSKSSEWLLHPITGILSVALILITGVILCIRRKASLSS